MYNEEKIPTLQEEQILSTWHSGANGRMEVLHTSDMHWIGAARVNPSHA